MTDSFPQNLAFYRAQRNLTQRELADLIGVSWSQISRYESGIVKPRLGSLLKLADALGVSRETLLGSHEETPHELSFGLPAEDIDELQKIAQETGNSLEEVISGALRWGLKMLKEDPEFAARVTRGIEEHRKEGEEK